MDTERERRPSAKERAEFLGVSALGAVLRRLPPDRASGLVARAFGVLMPRTSRHARALEHLALAFPEWSDAEREAVARRMWAHLGRVAGEAFIVDRLLADPARVTMPADFATFAERAKDGVIVAGLHLGNWEIAGAVAGRANLQLAGVYQALHNPLTDRSLRRMRAPVFPAGLFPKGPDLGRKLIRLARGGAAVGIVSDLREKRGIGVTFFGRPAYATPLPAMLARLTGRPLIVSTMVRTEGSRFRSLMEEVPVPVTDDREADIAATTQALHDVFERWIRLHPDQWLWTHRKWAQSAHRTLVVPAPAT